MGSLFTAVLRLRESSRPPTADALDALLRPVRGVSDVRHGPAASTLTIVFDHRLVGLGTLVRLIEDAGASVHGIRAGARATDPPAPDGASAASEGTG